MNTKEKAKWNSEKRRVRHILETWKTWKERDADYCALDEFLQRISNIIGVKA